MKMKRVMQSLGLALVVAFSGCDQNLNLGSRCNSKTCKGCCDAEGVCQSGVTENACGVNGGMCLTCDGQQCLSGVCQIGAGTGSGTGTTGGGIGSSGGGTGGVGGGGQIGRVDQELVSGTRLKAVRLTGDDGSQAPVFGKVFFWDSQLEQYCSPASTFTKGTGACWPLTSMAPMYTRDSAENQLFVDHNCNKPANTNLGSIELDQFPAKSWIPLAYGLETAAGGTGLYVEAKPYSGTMYKLLRSDGGCVLHANSAPDMTYEPGGRELMMSELAVMKMTVD